MSTTNNDQPQVTTFFDVMNALGIFTWRVSMATEDLTADQKTALLAAAQSVRKCVLNYAHVIAPPVKPKATRKRKTGMYDVH